MCVTDLMQPTTNSCNVSNQNFKSMPKQPNWHAIAFAIIQFKCYVFWLERKTIKYVVYLRSASIYCILSINRAEKLSENGNSTYSAQESRTDCEHQNYIISSYGIG